MDRSLRVSIVIPNYNGRDLLAANLPCVAEAVHAYPPGGEIILVDDGSSDGSPDWLARNFAGTRLLVHEKNLGFGAACTTGIRAAEHEAVVLLNTDTAVERDFLAPLLKTLSGRDVFAAGCLALEGDGRSIGENVKLPYLHSGKLKFRKLGSLEPGEARARLPGPRPTLFATAGFLALKKSLFLSLGGFDPLFEPFYYEDADLCYRAWKRGYRVLLEPRSVVRHGRQGGSIAAHHDPKRIRRIQERNRLLLLWKNLTSPALFRRAHLLPLLLRCATKWIVLDIDFYVALVGALRRLKPALMRRAREKSEAIRGDDEIFRAINHPD